ncbi:MAG: 5'-3' exoribonuclease [Chlamydiia bacterium]|nr:5'-3' exoribonuclease [Chlamydiia bacterium]
MTRKIDLHTHTTCSDGSLTPEELLKLAHKEGISVLSITDHDTLCAYTPEIKALASSLGIELLTGVEISTNCNGEGFHVLAYGLDPNNPDILELLEKNQEARLERNQKILACLEENGISIPYEEIKAGATHTIGRVHIANAMVDEGHVLTRQDAFDQYLGDVAKCHVPSNLIPIREAIAAIQAAGGAAVLAHPSAYRNRSELEEGVLDLPFDGIEVDYSLISSDQKEKWRKFAQKRKLVATGGSDFHGGPGAPHHRLAASSMKESEYEQLREILSRKKKRG